MKNKEIEEILNYIKQYVENNYYHDSDPVLNYKNLQIILSYIDQLEMLKEKYLFEKECYKIKINNVLQYCKESSLTIKSHFFSDVINILNDTYVGDDLFRMLGEI